MKSSGRGRKSGRRRKCLIVDGYNIIAKLSRSSLGEVQDLEVARDDLAGRLAEYGAYSGDDVIVVYDAHLQGAVGSEEERRGVRIVYTAQHETADERIERLVYELRDVYPEITVATSDFAEQQVIFGGGALRVSANELVLQLKSAERQIREAAKRTVDNRTPKISDTLRKDVADILEKWRRQ